MPRAIRPILALGLLLVYIATMAATNAGAAPLATAPPAVTSSAATAPLPLASPAATTPAAVSSTVWGCHPDRVPNPCTGSLKTTVLGSTAWQKRKVLRVEEPARTGAPAVDCFYVYPTVTSLARMNAPRHGGHVTDAIFATQAAPFSPHCRVFAPIYRQITFPGMTKLLSEPYPKDEATNTPTAAFNLAYGDVRQAWNDYLARDNGGRGVVLIGHSQGSAMLIRLMNEEIDRRPEVRARLVSAIVPGANLTVAVGQRAGGDLTAIPTCAAAGETGCVIAWSTYTRQPSKTALFGQVRSKLRSAMGYAASPGTEVVCVSPPALAGDGERLRPLLRSAHFPGAIGLTSDAHFLGRPPRAQTPWVSPGERYTATCEKSNGANVLIVRRGSPATFVPDVTAAPDLGLHLFDVNLPLGNLLTIVERQIAAYAAKD